MTQLPKDVCGCGVPYAEHGRGANGYCTPKPSMTQTNEGVTSYKKVLSEVCELSGMGYCPGCGLSPEGLEQILTTTKADWLRSEIEKLEGMKEELDHNRYCAIKQVPKEVASCGCWMGKEEALTTIITRYKI